ncbi:MAG: phage tail tape measure protein [Candidatus Hydrogenedentes bacterium]|nr:phage tail tape measure protein [Candidatus Hydrogenedentota bacterium]
MITLGDAVWLIRSDDSPLQQGLQSAQASVKGAMDGILAHSQAIGIGMTAVGGAITGILGLAVDAAADAEKGQAQLAAVLKSTGGAAGLTQQALNDMAAALQKTTTFEDDAITGAQSLLLTFTSVGRDVFPQAIETILDMSTALGQDLNSSTVQLGKALNDPIQGITALSRVGVSFTEQQKAQIEAMVEAGNVMGAQKLILAELNKEFGGSAAAAAGTFSGQMEQLKNQLGDVMEQIGTALMPVLQQMAQSLVPIIEKVAAWITANPELTATIVKVVAVIGALMAVLGPILVILPGIVSAFGVVSAAIAAISAPVAIAIAAIAAVIAIGAVVVYNWESISKALKKVWESIKKAAEFVWDALVAYFTFQVNILKKVFTALSDAFWAVFHGIADVFQWFWDVIQSVWNGVIGIFEWAADKIMAVWDFIMGMIHAGVQGIVDAISYIAGLFGFGGGDLNVNVSPGVGARASGGPVQAGLPYIVGERGDELFVPESNGRIVNASDTAAFMGGGQPINITINGANRDPREIADEVSRVLMRRQLAMGRA